MPSAKEQFEIKPPKTYKEQVEIFQSKNLHVEDPDKAENILQRVNYYRLSGYALTYRDPIHKNKYISGSSFETVLSIYEFDRKLRSLLLQVLEVIEISFRTHISYEFAHKFGPLGYKNKENFIDEKRHKESLEELDSMVNKSRKGELFIQHHFAKYDGQIPIWAIIEVTSFGFLSKFFRNLRTDLKKHIARTYYNLPFKFIESWLQTLSYIRNICAHYGRVYNKKLIFKPRLLKEDNEKFENELIFTAIFIIHRLLSKKDGQQFIIALEALIDEYDEYIDFQFIGFPKDWKELMEQVQAKK